MKSLWFKIKYYILSLWVLFLIEVVITLDVSVIDTAFQKRSEEIEQPEFIEKNYAAFAKKLLPNYLSGFSPFGKWVSRFDRYIFKGRLIKCLYPKRKLLGIQNIIECEAHWEVLCKGIEMASINDVSRSMKKS